MSRSMKSVIVIGQPSLRCEIRDVPILCPAPGEVLVKVVRCGSNPGDWKAPDHLLPGTEIYQGNDMSGTIEAVGKDVYEFRKGDRVAATHPMQTENGTYAEYSTAPAHLFSSSTEYIRLAPYHSPYAQQLLGLYQHLNIPFPTSSQSSKPHPPLIVYGAASAVGAYTLKLAKLGRFEKLIAVCGSGKDFVESLGVVTDLVDYRNGKVVSDLKRLSGRAGVITQLMPSTTATAGANWGKY